MDVETEAVWVSAQWTKLSLERIEIRIAGADGSELFSGSCEPLIGPPSCSTTNSYVRFRWAPMSGTSARAGEAVSIKVWDVRDATVSVTAFGRGGVLVGETEAWLLRADPESN